MCPLSRPGPAGRGIPARIRVQIRPPGPPHLVLLHEPPHGRVVVARPQKEEPRLRIYCAPAQRNRLRPAATVPALSSPAPYARYRHAATQLPVRFTSPRAERRLSCNVARPAGGMDWRDKPAGWTGGMKRIWHHPAGSSRRFIRLSHPVAPPRRARADALGDPGPQHIVGVGRRIAGATGSCWSWTSPGP
jgi:hypothetical protein